MHATSTEASHRALATTKILVLLDSMIKDNFKWAGHAVISLLCNIISFFILYIILYCPLIFPNTRLFGNRRDIGLFILGGGTVVCYLRVQ